MFVKIFENDDVWQNQSPSSYLRLRNRQLYSCNHQLTLIDAQWLLDNFRCQRKKRRDISCHSKDHWDISWLSNNSPDRCLHRKGLKNSMRSALLELFGGEEKGGEPECKFNYSYLRWAIGGEAHHTKPLAPVQTLISKKAYSRLVIEGFIRSYHLVTLKYNCLMRNLSQILEKQQHCLVGSDTNHRIWLTERCSSTDIALNIQNFSICSECKFLYHRGSC